MTYSPEKMKSKLSSGLQPPEPPSTNTGGGLPGFDNVPNAGGNQGGTIDSDGDINKQVGTMG